MTLKPMKRLVRCALVILLHAVVLQPGLLAGKQVFRDSPIRGTSEHGANWVIEMPAEWNGTVLVWSHGWSPVVGEAQSAAPGTRASLIRDGYALAASSYSAGGWAVAEAVPDQIEILDEFEERFGEPERVLAWGSSMGGLVSTALAERHGNRIDGVLTMCASSGGALGMMNTGLDGAWTFLTLMAPNTGIHVVDIANDQTNGALVREWLSTALESPEGRARVALASVLGGLPGWTQAGSPRPAPDDYATQAGQMAALFPMGVFLPRSEQESRAGGVFSWNTGVDYEDQLRQSGRRPLVEAMYAEASLSLEADLDRLNRTPRIEADPDAVEYMMRNFTPSGLIEVPVLTLHPIGDGVTSPSLAAGFAETVRAAGRGDLVRSAWTERAGHCTSTPAEMRAALDALEDRLDTGRWSVSPDELNARAREIDPSVPPAFVEHTPAPLMRPCDNRTGGCPGYRPAILRVEHTQSVHLPRWRPGGSPPARCTACLREGTSSETPSAGPAFPPAPRRPRRSPCHKPAAGRRFPRLGWYGSLPRRQ